MNCKIIILGIGLLFATSVLAKKNDSTDVKKPKKRVDFILKSKNNVSEVTSSISKITSKELMQTSARSLKNAFYGSGLGLTSLQGNGAPWEQLANFNIRGLQSLSGSGVLIVVDGIERSIDELTTEEVEAVYILKDAAAVALYGYKGINGVISVVTKRGKLGKIKIGLSYDHGFHMPKKMPNMADSYTYALAMNEAFSNDQKLNPRYNDFELNAIKNNEFPFIYPNVNWWDETIGETGHSNNYNITVQGGNKNVKYYTMFNLENNSGFLKHTSTNDGYTSQLKYSKANVRSNLDIRVTNSTQLQVNIMGILAEHNRPGRIHSNIMYDIYTLPSIAFPVKTKDGVYGGNLIWGAKNPVAALESTGYCRSHGRTLYADAKLTQKLDMLLNGLSVSARIGYDNAIAFWENRMKSFEYASDEFVFSEGLPQKIVRIKGGKLSELGFNKSNGPRYYNYNFEGQVNYSTKINTHQLYTSLICNFEHRVSAGRHNTLNRINYNWYTHYGWRNKYYADLSLGVSGSNRLPAEHKYNFSPVLSFAWLLSEEDFLKSAKWIDLLKLRLSSGILHTDHVPEWNITSQSFSGGGEYYFGENNVWSGGTQEGRLPTTNFKAERARKIDLGVDLSLFNFMDLTIDGYFQRRDRIMVTKAGYLSNVLGVGFSYSPEGIVDSKGLEVGLNYNPKVNNWTFSVGGNFAITKNEVINKNESPQPEEYLRSTGLPIDQPFGYEAIGFFKDVEDIKNSPQQLFSDVRPGDIKYKDQNNDGFVDDNDRVPIGYNTNIPEIYYSFHLGLEYKNFGFDALFQGTGNVGAFMTTPSVYRPLVNNNNISQFYYDNRWTPENGDAKFPRLTYENNDNNNRNSKVWYSDASYLKLRHCELYYKLPSSLISKVKMSHAKIYLRGVNLFTFSSMDLFDPESIGCHYPHDWALHLGLSINF